MARPRDSIRKDGAGLKNCRQRSTIRIAFGLEKLVPDRFFPSFSSEHEEREKLKSCFPPSHQFMSVQAPLFP
jgi:hypothetical protein